jgi:hypothetical protein
MSRSLKQNAQEVLMKLSMTVCTALDKSGHRTSGKAIPMNVTGFTTEVAGPGTILFLFDIEDQDVKFACIVYSDRGRLKVVSHPTIGADNKVFDACFEAAKQGIEKTVREWQ